MIFDSMEPKSMVTSNGSAWPQLLNIESAGKTLVGSGHIGVYPWTSKFYSSSHKQLNMFFLCRDVNGIDIFSTVRPRGVDINLDSFFSDVRILFRISDWILGI